MKLTDIQHWIRVKAQNTQEYYEKHGVWKSILHFFEKIGLGYKKSTLIFFELKLDDMVPYYDKDTTIEFVKVGKEELEHTETYFDGWFDRSKALKRLDEGHILFAVKEKGTMIFFQWLEFKKVTIPFLELSFQIPENTACMAYIYTLPDYRGKGIASKAKPLVLEYLQKQKFQRIFLTISPKNPISQRVNKKLGFNEYQTVICRRFSFLKYYSVKDFNTNQKKIFWRHQKIERELWNTFSKIRHD